jgi:hypothetical protein
MCLPLLVLIICWEISLHFKDDLLNTCGQVFLFGLCSGVSTICVGNEWYQYPSSFFLSSSNYQVGWLQDGFEGALPLPFVRAEGGTRSAPKYFNNKNKASPHQYVADEDICDFLVELELDRPGHIYRSHDKETWEVSDLMNVLWCIICMSKFNSSLTTASDSILASWALFIVCPMI